MFAVNHKTVRIDLNNPKDLKIYDEILNDPTCQIVREVREKITTKAFNDEGKIAGLSEELIAIVTYQKRSYLEE